MLKIYVFGRCCIYIFAWTSRDVLSIRNTLSNYFFIQISNIFKKNDLFIIRTITFFILLKNCFPAKLFQQAFISHIIWRVWRVFPIKTYFLVDNASASFFNRQTFDKKNFYSGIISARRSLMPRFFLSESILLMVVDRLNLSFSCMFLFNKVVLFH